MLICFDFDGTMADTESLTLPDFWAYLNEDYGIPMTQEVWMERYHGKAGPSLLAELNAAYGTHMEWPSFVARRNLRLPPLFAKGIDLAPGLGAVLTHLQTQSIPYCICTNSQGARNVMALTHLRLPYEDIRTHLQSHCYSGVEDGNASKPAPDVYLQASRTLNTPPQHCVAIEDTPAGARAALAAGFGHVLGYVGLAAHPAHEAQRLLETGVHGVIENWNDFLPWLAKRGFLA